jgi:hypothetical protein
MPDSPSGGAPWLSEQTEVVQDLPRHHLVRDRYLEVQSDLGRGSAFIVTLELAEAQGPAGVAQASSWGTITGYQGERRSILVVDDNPTNRAVLRGLLAPLGFEMSEAEGGEAALLVARQRRPALILMDLAMPEMDGCEALLDLADQGRLEGRAYDGGLGRARPR